MQQAHPWRFFSFRLPPLWILLAFPVEQLIEAPCKLSGGNCGNGLANSVMAMCAFMIGLEMILSSWPRNIEVYSNVEPCEPILDELQSFVSHNMMCHPTGYVQSSLLLKIAIQLFFLKGGGQPSTMVSLVPSFGCLWWHLVAR